MSRQYSTKEELALQLSELQLKYDELKALSESESRYRLLADNATDVIWVQDIESNSFNYISPSVERLLGYSTEEVISHGLEKILTKSSLQYLNSVIPGRVQRFMKGQEEFYTDEIEHVHKNGSTGWLEISSHLIRNNQNGRIEATGAARNISEWKKSEIEREKAVEELLAREIQFQNLFDTMAEGVVLSSRDGLIIKSNLAAERILGISKQQIDNHKIISPDWEILRNDGTPMPFEEMAAPRALKENCLIKDIVAGLRKPQGDIIWLNISANPFMNKNGQVDCIVSTFSNITDRILAEQALKDSQRHAGALLNAIPDMMFMLNGQGVYIDYKSAFDDLAYQDSTIIGKRNRDIMPPEFADLLDEQINRTIRTGEMQSFEFQLTLPAKGIRDYEARMVRGGPNEVIAIVRDVSDRKKTESEIKNKNEELLKINEEKDKFFSIIAHDMRGPFNNFLGLTRMMVEDLPTMSLDESRTIALSMKNSANKLFNLLENLLEWSLMKRGMTNFNPESFALKNKIQESIQSILESASNKEIVISINIPGEIVLTADLKMFESTMRNLVFNAVKFTPRGGKIVISAKQSSYHTVEISVKDTGIGLSKFMTENLFHIDSQTNRRGTEGEPTSGLGLILCREFIEKHGGKLWVESEENKGSTFNFTIPFLPT